MGNEHWVETELGNILYLKNGYAFKSSSYSNIGTPLIRISDIQNEKVVLTDTVKIPDEFYKEEFTVINGDLLIAMSGATTGKFGKYTGKEKVLQNQRVGNLKLFSDSLVMQSYRDYLMASLGNTIEKAAYGGAQPNISPDKIHEILIPLAPLDEQKRIVAKLDAILPKVKDAKARLEKIPTVLKKFRQSVLAAACSGRLTEDWREGKNLPEWKSSLLGEHLSRIQAGKSINCEERPPQNDEIGIVKVSAVSWGTFDENESKTIRNISAFKQDYLIKVGDFLFSRANTTELVGACVMVEHVSKRLMLSDKILRFSFASDCLPHWVLYSLRSQNGREQIEAFATGNQLAMKNISQEKIRNIEISLPPLDEQQEIVRRVEQLFKVADSIEAKYKKAMERVEKIEQAVLAKAFRGELVEPDPNDEPAAELLKRILAEKAKMQDVKKTRKQK